MFRQIHMVPIAAADKAPMFYILQPYFGPCFTLLAKGALEDLRRTWSVAGWLILLAGALANSWRLSAPLAALFTAGVFLPVFFSAVLRAMSTFLFCLSAASRLRWRCRAVAADLKGTMRVANGPSFSKALVTSGLAKDRLGNVIWPLRSCLAALGTMGTFFSVSGL